MKKINVFSKLQLLGKSLMLPIAVLPVAALLLRFGSPDMLNLSFVKSAGNAVFANLSVLFAIGIAFGIAHNNHGAAALAGAISYFVIEAGAKSINGDIKMGVFSGIIAGIVAGNCYNKFKDIKVPEWLGFFGGRRFVPIISALFSVIISGILGYVFPIVQKALDTFGMWMTKSGEFGLFIYGFLQRLLIPFGLHHVLNSIVRFMFGEYTDPAGKVFIGDQVRFFAGDPTAGIYMAGAFIVMMFGLPGAAFAIYKCAKTTRQKEIVGVLISVALTSFLTGITEPIEFLFIFSAPILFVLHSIYMGLAYAVTNYFGILHGFGFSAGLIDYILNFKLATKPLLILPIGVGFFFLYYFTFSFLIKKMNYPTLGRENEDSNTVEEIKNTDENSKINFFIEALGGKDNFITADSCITRLRLDLKDRTIIDEEMLKSLGAKGVMKPGHTSVQVILGTSAERIANGIKEKLR
ncbi:N-acetylglucosamine-specific PTS transporter subunit IIBC [uncultured Fusobacterium sp.]|uniref:N-acetylglucosamine-specific PTS transporter subunit IIBC n=1 Tax=uncultured Fusobacterium sp. TaxID=159267 RepID=UPI00258DECBF|nr:N-acetylglucosamine-specific PTS transporter subunit IIBC [uncultured Fusobacterium sp.]